MHIPFLVFVTVICAEHASSLGSDIYLIDAHQPLCWHPLICVATHLGTCTGIVVKTGDNTAMGRIARLTGSIPAESKCTS